MRTVEGKFEQRRGLGVGGREPDFRVFLLAGAERSLGEAPPLQRRREP